MTKTEHDAIALLCAKCKGNGDPKQVHPVPWCEGGCCEIDRELKLMRKEAQK